MANFDKIFEEIIIIEGGYSNHPNDSGGQTMYGVTEQVARSAGYQGKMENLSLETAKNIYKTKFFDKYEFGKIQNSKIAGELFEFTVNTGRGNLAIKFLQRSFNLLNKNISLEENGVLGNDTVDSINSYKFYKSLFKVLNIFQGMYYISIAEDDSLTKESIIHHKRVKGSENNKTFIRGWIDRRVSI